MTIEGEEGIGKTTLLAEFGRALPNTAISLFMRAGDRLSYDPEHIQLSLADQLSWALKAERAPLGTAPGYDLNYLYGELQKRATRKKTVYYFLLDGMSELPDHASGMFPRLMELLPTGRAGFKFILTGDARFYAPYLPSSLSLKLFPLIEFSLDDTVKYFSDISLDRDDLQELHKRCKGVPGRLADVRRLLELGLPLTLCLEHLSKRQPNLFFIEWQRVDQNNEYLRKLLAVLSHDDKSHTLASIAELVGITDSEVGALLAPLTFVTIDPDRGRILCVRGFSQVRRGPIKDP